MLRKSKKKTILAIALLLVFAVIIVIGFHQSQQEVKQYTVEEYFEVTAAVEPMGNDLFENNGTVWIIHAIWAGVRPVKGDAHAVVVQSWAGSDPLNLGDIPKGQIRRDIMNSYLGSHIAQNRTDGNFHVTLRIYSQEASGRVDVVLPM